MSALRVFLAGRIDGGAVHYIIRAYGDCSDGAPLDS